MKPLKVNQEYRDLVPRPVEDDYRALEENMIERGEATEPIVINKDGVILDGYTRYQICQRHGLFYETVQRDFETPEDERRFVKDTNLYRRHLSPYQKVCMAKEDEDEITEAAGLRMKAGTLVAAADRVRSSEVIAKRIGVSRGTYDRAKKIRDEGDVNMREKVLSGELSISAAYNQLMPKPPKPVKPDPPKPSLYRVTVLTLSVPDTITDAKLWGILEKTLNRHGVGFTIREAQI